MIALLRHLRRLCAGIEQRNERRTSGRSRNFNCAVPYVKGGDMSKYATARPIFSFLPPALRCHLAAMVSTGGRGYQISGIASLGTARLLSFLRRHFPGENFA